MRKTCRSASGLFKKDIELVTSSTNHITDIFLFGEQAQMDNNTLSQLLSKVPYVHYLSTEHFPFSSRQ
ncbi:MAG: hypothetical protein ACLS3V_09770 [Streptococcus sp.]